MDIRSILVSVDINPAASKALPAAIGLARRFNAQLIGVAADEPSIAIVGLDGGAAAADFYATERIEVEARLRTAEAAFRTAVPAEVKCDWRAFVTTPTRALIDSAHVADLIVTGNSAGSIFNAEHRIDVGGLVLSAGRPVLNVADGVREITTDKVVIGWKNVREARRAVSDALPLLRGAKDIVAITLSEGAEEAERAGLDDLLAWLRRHGVAARSELVKNSEGFVDVLESTARAYEADLVVAGGYGHSRMREWLFGGMTRDLLQASTLNRLLSN
jgi:nucleotide-binding universal stress UspA family protein